MQTYWCCNSKCAYDRLYLSILNILYTYIHIHKPNGTKCMRLIPEGRSSPFQPHRSLAVKSGLIGTNLTVSKTNLRGDRPPLEIGPEGNQSKGQSLILKLICLMGCGALQSWHWSIRELTQCSTKASACLRRREGKNKPTNQQKKNNTQHNREKGAHAEQEISQRGRLLYHWDVRGCRTSSLQVTNKCC